MLSMFAGAYTSARTVGGTRVFQLAMHIQRIISTTAEMHASDGVLGPPPPAFLDAVSVRASFVSSVRAALELLGKSADSKAGGEYKISAVYAVGSSGVPTVRVHVCSLHPRPPGSAVDVLIAQHERPHATAKDTRWALERASLEPKSYGPPGFVADDTVLMSAKSEFLEGTQTNFGAFIVRTAAPTAQV